MTEHEFRNLEHGDKIVCPKTGANYIVHNIHRTDGGMSVAIRTAVIRGFERRNWKVIRSPVMFSLVPGHYEVTINRKID